MTVGHIKVWNVTLTVVALGAILWYLSASTNTPGIVYLIAAIFLNAFSIYARRAGAFHLRRGDAPNSMWLCRERAQVMLMVALQLTTVALLSIWATKAWKSPSAFVLSNIAVALCIIGWDHLVAIADNPQQEGISVFMTVAGRPRTRRVFFWVWCVYPLCALILAEVFLLSANHAYPTVFDPPQMGLLIEAVLSTVAGGLIFQRYRSTSFRGLRKETFVLGGFAVGVAAICLQVFFAWAPYVIVLSNWVVACAAWSAYWLWHARSSGVSLAT